MKYLPWPSELKLFIVRALACYDAPTEVVRQVAEQFNIKVTRSSVQRYDPTTVAGQTLSAELKALFDSTRKNFLEHLEAVPLAHRTVRLRKLQSVYDEAMANNNLKVAVAALTAAQRETADIEYVEIGENLDV